MTWRRGRLWRLWVHWRVRRQARIDARVGSSSGDLVVDRWLEPRPKFDPINNTVHQKIAVDKLPTDVDEWKKEFDTVDRSLTHHIGAWAWRLLLLVLAIAETEGGILFFKDFGAAGAQRVFLAVALTTVLFALSWASAHLTTRKDENGLPVRSRWVYAVIGAFGLLALGLAVSRIASLPPDAEGSRAAAIAMSLVMVAASTGPALCAEIVMRKLQPVAQLTKLRRQLRRRIKRAERRIANAHAYCEALERHANAWDNESGRIVAVYQLTYRYWTAVHHPDGQIIVPLPPSAPPRIPPVASFVERKGRS